MNWIEVKLRVDGEAAEAVSELFQRYGHQGVSIEQDGIMPEAYAEDDAIPPPEKLIIRAYLPDDERFEAARHQLESALSYMNMMYPMPAPEYTSVKDEDWAEAWKAHYHPVRVGRRFYIRPVWIDVEAQPDDLLISLDPGTAFGTGTHPTTQLCLETLEDLVQPGYKVLDLGCGSGILAIAALKLGAASALGLDTEPFAVEATTKNAAENGLAGKLTAQQGSLENVVGAARRFDLIVVNILARIIIRMCDEGLGQTVRPGGVGIFSGIIEEQAADVEAALRATGLTPYKRRQTGDWVVIEARRPHV